MKILALGLIHKNNTDNQPIEYVYRTLIIAFEFLGFSCHIKGKLYIVET